MPGSEQVLVDAWLDIAQRRKEPLGLVEQKDAIALHHRPTGAHAAWNGGHLLGQQPERSALGFVVWTPTGSARQLGRDQHVIDPTHRGIGTDGAGRAESGNGGAG
jgi:hypothetical protein